MRSQRHMLTMARAIGVCLAMGVLTVFATGVFQPQIGNSVTLRFSPGNRPTLTVTNNSIAPITGMLIATKSRSADGHKSVLQVITYDPSTHDRAYEPIPPGGSHTVQVGYFGGTDSALLQPEVKAAIFADGSTFGDPDWVEELRSARQCSFKELGVLERLLTDANDGQLDVAAVLSVLKAQQESLKSIPSNPKTRTGQCRTSAHFIYNSPIRAFERLSRTSTEPADMRMAISIMLESIHEERAKLVAVGVSTQVENIPKN